MPPRGSAWLLDETVLSEMLQGISQLRGLFPSIQRKDEIDR